MDREDVKKWQILYLVLGSLKEKLFVRIRKSEDSARIDVT